MIIRGKQIQIRNFINTIDIRCALRVHIIVFSQFMLFEVNRNFICFRIQSDTIQKVYYLRLASIEFDTRTKNLSSLSDFHLKYMSINVSILYNHCYIQSKFIDAHITINKAKMCRHAQLSPIYNVPKLPDSLFYSINNVSGLWEIYRETLHP